MSLDKLAEIAKEIEKEDDQTAQHKWANVRQHAIQFLREKKERWQRLQDERQIRLTEVVIYFIFVVLVTVVALTSRNTEVHPPPPPLSPPSPTPNICLQQDAFWLSSGLRGYLQDSEFPPNNISNMDKSFSSIATPAHLSM